MPLNGELKKKNLIQKVCFLYSFMKIIISYFVAKFAVGIKKYNMLR